MRRILLFVPVLFLAIINTSSAQTCTTLGQTPPTAFPVCGTTQFVQNSVPLCGNQVIPVNCFDGAFYSNRNPFWYKFTCYVGGTLGFTITPFVLSDDYDWQLFDVTNRNPMDVFTDPTMFVACNWSFMSGTTGASPAGTTLLGCSADPATFSQMPVLIVGHQYLLLISHFTNTQSGYSLSFGGGTGSITDPNVPVITTATPNCDGTKIVVKFSKPLICASLTGNGSDFTTTPAGAITTAQGHGCSSGFTIDSVTLTLSSPLVPGNYTLNAVLGTDGNTLTDNCGLSIPTGFNVPFNIAVPVPLPMGAASIVACAPTSITLQFTDPIRCNSIAANGSDFGISGPSPVTVNAATATCNANGETNTITVQLASPLLVPGTYQLQVISGTDGNTLLGQCSRPVPAGSMAGFSLAPQPPLPMGTIASPGCSPSSVVLNLPEPVRCNTLAADGSDFIIVGPNAVVITGATTTCNGSGETTSISIQLSTPITTGGNFVLTVQNGSDGNTLLGNCFRQINAGSNAAFAIPVVPPSLMTQFAPIGCRPSTIRVMLDAPVQCSSIAADGTDFLVTGPRTVTVTGATGACPNGLTTSIDITLSAPIETAGLFSLAIVAGSDGNTLLSNCNRATPTSSLPFTTFDTVSAAFTYSVISDCNTNSVTFTHPGGNNINSWNWTVNGTIAGTQQTFTHDFPATSNQTVGLTVSNGVCTAFTTENMDFDNKVNVDFDVPEFICPEDSAIFINTSTGPIDNWNWNFGNGQASTQQHPQPQVYPITGQNTFYNITLTASNVMGCNSTKTKSLKVLGTCLIAVPTGFTPNNDGLNDYLFPLNAFNADELDFRIYNRWGEQVFHSTDWTKKWDGRVGGVMQGSAVFAWTLRYKDKRTGQRHGLKGTSILIR